MSTWKVINNTPPEMELSFGQAMEAVKQGKRVTMVDWEVPYQTQTNDNGQHIVPPQMKPTYLKMCYTNEPEINEQGDHIINQRFIAKFFYNGGYMPQPYSPTQYELIVGRYVILNDNQ